MLNQNLDIIFSYDYGRFSQALRCTWVKFAVKLIGSVEDDMEYDLVEDYKAVRQIIKLKVRLNFTQSLWMANFIADPAKKLTIDGTEIEVVNGFDEIDFELYDDFSVYAHPEMVFLKKDAGLAQFSEMTKIGYLKTALTGVVP